MPRGHWAEGVSPSLRHAFSSFPGPRLSGKCAFFEEREGQTGLPSHPGHLSAFSLQGSWGSERTGVVPEGQGATSEIPERRQGTGRATRVSCLPGCGGWNLGVKKQWDRAEGTGVGDENKCRRVGAGYSIQGTLSWESCNSPCDLGHIVYVSGASVSPPVDKGFRRRVSEVSSSPDCL